MAKVKIQFSELYSQKSQIVVYAAQSGRFLKEVNRQLKNGFGKDRHDIAEGYVKDAIANIKGVFAGGVEGASTSKYAARSHSRITVSFQPFGRYASTAYEFYSNWDDLAPSTVARKSRNQSIGEGFFWLDTGKLRGESAIRSMMPPKITYTTEIFPDSVRRQGTKDDRIDFSVTLTFGEMNFPFDDLVRRPLVTGEEDSSTPDGDGGSWATKILTNEFGSNISGHAKPARPWIRKLSANIGEAMFDELNTNR